MEAKKISIKQIKSDLLQGITLSAIDYLKVSTSPLIFQEFKEQKLLLYVPQDAQLKNEYINSVKRLLQSEIEIKEELAYINFVEVYIAETTRLYDDLLKTVDKNLLVNLKTFLFNIISAVDEHVDHMLQTFYQDFEKDDITTNTPNELTEKHEWAFNGLRGKLNDVMFAVTRLINSYPFLCENIDLINTYNKDGIATALTICSNLNSFDYALDKISYDEWYVFKKDEMEDDFFFRIKDLNLEKARDLGLKRELSSLMLGIQKNKRWLQELFANPIMEIFEWIWEYYQNKNTIILNENDIYESAKNSIINSLKSLGADDELLVSTENDKSEVLPYYYVAAILNTFSRINQEFKLNSLRNKFDYTAPEIPIDFANSIFNRLGNWKNDFQYYLHHSLMQILNGAHVKFTTSDGKVIFDKKYINSNVATTEEFISFLSLPLDWRIGAQNYEVKYHKEIFNNFKLNFPILINEDNKIDNKVAAKN